jgi:hypothetical protein
MCRAGRAAMPRTAGASQKSRLHGSAGVQCHVFDLPVLEKTLKNNAAMSEVLKIFRLFAVAWLKGKYHEIWGFFKWIYIERASFKIHR